MVKKRKSQGLKKKKKMWYQILAPSKFENKELGESYVSEPKELLGKRIKVNLLFLARSRNPNVRLSFSVKEIKEGKGLTELTSYHILPSHIKRMARKNKSKVDISKKVKSKDGLNIVIKFVIVTRHKISKGILKSLINYAEKTITEEISKKPLDKIFDDVISYYFQMGMRKKLSKVYPVSAFEVRELKKK